ncbi:MAG: PHP domain-containing protein [Candidatus Sulfotelmatobacter sp.]
MYVELHARSAFSFLEGSSLPEDLAGACARFNMPAMALLDTDGVYGAPRFHQAAKKLGIKAYIGAEVTCAVSQSTIKNQQSAIAPVRIGNPFRLPLLVSSRAGYRNLCRLITKMKLRAKKGEGAVHKEELEEHAGGLICLTGGTDGPLAIALQHGGIEEARKQVEPSFVTHSPPSAITAHSRPPDVCWHATPSVI